jgi:Tfp pilus assembly PilM family ATPase
VLDHQVVGHTRPDDGAARMQVLLVAARTSMVEALIAATKQAGLKPESIDLDAFALVRTLAEDSSGEETARVFCHLGSVTNLAIAVANTCFFTRPLSLSWDGEGSASALADEIRLSIDYYMAQPSARQVGEVVLSGPGSRDIEFVTELAEHIGLTTQVAEPLGRLDTSAVAIDDPLRYTVAAGLAVGAVA